MNSVREQFLRFFQSQLRFKALDSASLLVPQTAGGPGSDLLFVSAGMVPLMNWFMGQEPAPEPRRFASAQRCLRVSGKHNDLDEVGRTQRHHTLFEMLGSFYFGARGQEPMHLRAEAMHDSWTFLTEHCRLDPARLHVTVHAEDRRSADMWHKACGVPFSHITQRGDEDNWWSAGGGPLAPAGPCSEVHWDRGEQVDGEHLLELWNLVFMTQRGDGTPLPAPCIDTGMGLERLAAVVGGVQSTFEVDEFRRFNEAVGRRHGQEPPPSSSDVDLRIVADHLRAAWALIGDGLVPSGAGQGYVLRRLVRRALLHLEVAQPGAQLADLVPLVAESGLAPPGQPPQTQEQVARVLSGEQAAFSRALLRGMATLERDAQSCGAVSPELAFLLLDSHGFPVELTATVAQQRGWTMAPGPAIEALVRQQKERSQRDFLQSKSMADADAVASGGHDDVRKPEVELDPAVSSSTLSGSHDFLAQLCARSCRVIGVDSTHGRVAIDPCPFYPTSGGQQHDLGWLWLEGAGGTGGLPETCACIDGRRLGDCVGANCTVDRSTAVAVTNVQKDEQTGVTWLTLAKETGGLPALSSSVAVQVDGERRHGLAVHHSATHLLHAALRRVLGDSVTQAGSAVAPDRLRFDFTFGRALSDTELDAVAQWMDGAVQQGRQSGDGAFTARENVPLREATEQDGAQANFSEKYGDRVRVVSAVHGQSVELCGGCHVADAGHLNPVLVLRQSAVAAGIRRLEVQAGSSAQRTLLQRATAFTQVARLMSWPELDPEAAVAAARQLKARDRDRKKELKQLKFELHSLTKKDN